MAEFYEVINLVASVLTLLSMVINITIAIKHYCHLMHLSQYILPAPLNRGKVLVSRPSMGSEPPALINPDLIPVSPGEGYS